jgi:hypothetical protein
LAALSADQYYFYADVRFNIESNDAAEPQVFPGLALFAATTTTAFLTRRANISN